MSDKLNAIHLACLHFTNWTYGPMSYTKKTIDCCALAAQLIRMARGFPFWARPSEYWWRDMMIMDTDDLWSPVKATGHRLQWHPKDSLGMPAMEEGHAYLCQGWRHLVDGTFVPGESQGHTWIWVYTGKGLGYVIESSGRGPRIWDKLGKRPFALAFDEWGQLKTPSPMPWADRAAKWTSGVAYCRIA